MFDKREVCPVCGSTAREFLFEASDKEYNLPGIFPVVRCSTCTVSYLSIFPGTEQIGSYYPSDYTAYNFKFDLKAKIFSKLIQIVSGSSNDTYFGIPVYKPIQEGQRMLDIGSGSGIILKLYQEKGWEVTGLDFNEDVVEALRKKGLNCVRGDASSPPFEEGTFDVIVASQVLEHLYEPVNALKNWISLLSNGGRLFLGLPNFDSISRILFNKWQFGALSIPRHLVHFNTRSLYNSLRAAGFSKFEVKTVPHPSFFRSLCVKWGMPYSDIVNSRVINLFSFLSLPLEFFFSLIGYGDGLVAIAEKRE